MLTLAREHRAEELVVGMARAKVLKTGQVRLSDAVAGQFHCSVHAALNTYHQRKWQAALPAERQYRPIDQSRALRVGRVLKRRRQRHHHVQGVHALGPVAQEPLHLLHRSTGEIRLHLIAGPSQAQRSGIPIEQKRVNPQRGGEPFVPLEAGVPQGRLQLVEWRVGHANRSDLGQVHAACDIVVRILPSKPPADGRQIPLVGVQAKPVKRCQQATTRL